jgi:hypothetical protein
MLIRRCTLLGVGPMSINCVNAAIELSNEYEIPLMLIASRRQIDSTEFGGGYVHNWATSEFADYVTRYDKKGMIYLARDHGGPWQNTAEIEKKLSLRKAMESAKLSYKADIDAGFQILHIDPSIDIYGTPDQDEILDRLFELYEYCWMYSQRADRQILFEIGTDEQSGTTNRLEELEYTLSEMRKFCHRSAIPLPLFVVIQNGTKVMETRNIGSFDLPLRMANEIPAEIQVPKMIELCARFNIYIKVHNTDYLSDEALQWHPRLGIHAANVAPEYGVAETKAMIAILEENGLNWLVDRFIRIAYDSKKWTKWMLPDTKATDREKAVIAGHYVFSDPECIKLKAEAKESLVRKGLDLDDFLKAQIKKSIVRYLINFRLLRSV